jgi:putative RNA 2'-phosphotransferase
MTVVNERLNDRASRFMAWALRHEPEAAGISVDAHGWVSVSELLHCMQQRMAITSVELTAIVAADEKGRYAISPDGRFIRATYAHSIAITLDMPPAKPPAILFHGTARDSLVSIKHDGLLPRNRRFVHLTDDLLGAFTVGRRHGRAVVIPVDAAAMHTVGFVFYNTSAIWMTSAVPAQYLHYDGLMFDDTAMSPSSV